MTLLLPQKSLSYIDYIKVSASILPSTSKHFGNFFNLQAELDDIEYAKRSVFIASFGMIATTKSESPTKIRTKLESPTKFKTISPSKKKKSSNNCGELLGDPSLAGLEGSEETSPKNRKIFEGSGTHFFKRPSKNFRNILNVEVGGERVGGSKAHNFNMKIDLMGGRGWDRESEPSDLNRSPGR